MAETENLKARFAVMVTTRALSKLAANGDADAQFRLGYRFAFGKDKRRRNLKRAFSMWKAAAEQLRVDPTTVANWSKGRTRPRAFVWPAIIQFLG